MVRKQSGGGGRLKLVLRDKTLHRVVSRAAPAAVHGNVGGVWFHVGEREVDWLKNSTAVCVWWWLVI